MIFVSQRNRLKHVRKMTKKGKKQKHTLAAVLGICVEKIKLLAWEMSRKTSPLTF